MTIVGQHQRHAHPMQCLVVIAHPVSDSLCHAVARSAIETLTGAGHNVQVEDL